MNNFKYKNSKISNFTIKLNIKKVKIYLNVRKWQKNIYNLSLLFLKLINKKDFLSTLILF